MKLDEFAKKYYHKGFVKFDYVDVDSGYVIVCDCDGLYWKQMLEVVDEGRCKFSNPEQIKYNDELIIEKEELDESIRIRLSKHMKDEISDIARIRGMKVSEYIRTVLIANDIMREQKEREDGYVII